MADEIKLTLDVRLENGNFKDAFQPGQIKIDQAAAGGHRPVAIIGTTEEVIATGDVSTLGWLIMRNLDNTNYITWGPESAGAMVPIGRLKPGEWAACRLEPGVTIRAQANTAACKLDQRIYED
jgi:hypothetical protein